MAWTDTEWTGWMTADALVQKHKHRFENHSDSSSTVHQLYTVYKEYTTGCCCSAAGGSTIAEQLPLPPQPTSLDNTMHKKCIQPESQETAQSEQHWQALMTLFVGNSKLSMIAHLVRIFSDNVRGSYVMFFIITRKILTPWQQVIIPGLPKRTQA